MREREETGEDRWLSLLAKLARSLPKQELLSRRLVPELVLRVASLSLLASACDNRRIVAAGHGDVFSWLGRRRLRRVA